MGAAVAVTSLTLRGIARKAVLDSLHGSAAAQAAFQDQRYRQLLLISRFFAADPYLSAYLSEAANTQDTRSILDQLNERRNDLQFDFAIVLDPKGKVIARTDRPQGTGEDLSKRPLVAAALAADNQESRGVWREEGDLYYAVAVPVKKDFTPFGYLITGFQISDQAEGVRELREVSGADVAFVAATPEGPRIVATTLPPSTARSLASALATGDRMGQALRAGKELPRTELSLNGEPWIVVESPLRDADGAPVGATVALASLERALATYHQIQTVLLGTGLAAVLIAPFLAFAFARRALRPVRQLAAAAEAARGRGTTTSGSTPTAPTRWGGSPTPSTSCWPTCARSATWRSTSPTSRATSRSPPAPASCSAKRRAGMSSCSRSSCAATPIPRPASSRGRRWPS